MAVSFAYSKAGEMLKDTIVWEHPVQVVFSYAKPEDGARYLREFEDFLKAGPDLVVVSFSAKWCGPCKIIRPFVYEYAARYENVQFCIVDVDVAEDVANHCGIIAMPTFQMYKKEQKIFEITGVDAKKLEEKIRELM